MFNNNGCSVDVGVSLPAVTRLPQGLVSSNLTASTIYAALAQSGEHSTVTAEVRGSKPLCRAIYGLLAQLGEHRLDKAGVPGSKPG